MDFRNPSLLALSVLLFALCLSVGSGAAWGDETLPEGTGGSPNSKVIRAQIDAPAPGTKVTVTEVEVKAEKEKKPKKGAVEDGYRVDSVSVGPLGDKDLLDTPYSINVVPSDLINNQQATTMEEVYRYLPSMKFERRFGPDVGRPQTRGFQGSPNENTMVDGMAVGQTTAFPLEQFERIEVLNGLAGSLYGPANPAGIFNYVLKRPTDKPLYQTTASYSSQSQTTYHADLGGPMGKKFGYRINLLYGDGKGFVDQNQSNLRRNLASAALDWYITDKTVAELNFSYYDYNSRGYPGSFSYAADIGLPNAPDPTRRGYGQEWAGTNLTTSTYSLRVKHDFNQDWHLTAGIQEQDVNRDLYTVTNQLTNNRGAYRTTFAPSTMGWIKDSAILYLNGRAKTWNLTHDLTLGANGYYNKGTSPMTSMSRVTLGTASIDNPVSYDEPSWWLNRNSYKSGVTQKQSVIVGDTIAFSKYWSTMFSASYSWFRSSNYNANGVNTSRNHDSGNSYAASLMYKPRENITTYVMYADSLQQGATAPTTAANANETLSPYRSEQWEAGLKVALNKINLTGAVFRIERPFPYTDTDNVFRVQGNQVNYGLELMAIGEVVDRLTVYGGITLLDPKLKDTGRAATSNTQVVGVPKVQGNLLVEYQLPFITGLTPYLNLHYSGRQAANDVNTSWADPYTTIDLGARYVVKIGGVETTWRFAVKNLTDKRYWASIMPGSTDGAGGSCTAWLGSPREYVGSVQFNF